MQYSDTFLNSVIQNWISCWGWGGDRLYLKVSWTGFNIASLCNWGKCRKNVYIIFSISRFNEVYTWNNVNSCVHNIIVGQLWIEQVSSCLFCLFHVWTDNWGAFHTSLEEFENEVFILKTHQLFSVHTKKEGIQPRVIWDLSFSLRVAVPSPRGKGGGYGYT